MGISAHGVWGDTMYKPNPLKQVLQRRLSDLQHMLRQNLDPIARQSVDLERKDCQQELNRLVLWNK